MKIRLFLARTLAAALAFASLSAAAQSCLRPTPFSDVAGIGNAGEWQGAAGTDCVLRSNIATTGGVLRGSYVKAVTSSAQRLRVRFHVDMSQLDTLTGLRVVSLVNVVAPAPQVFGTTKTALLAQLAIRPPRKPMLAAASTMPVTPLTGTDIASPQFDVGLEVTMGSTGMGKVSYWIDTGFDQAPTGVLNVDNLQWGSIAGVAIGQMGATNSYLANEAGKDVFFSNIGIDDQLFLGTFE